MEPYGIQWRESRDSRAHPESRAVAVLFDVTGSMGRVPRSLQANLCQLMNLLLDKHYLAHPQILIGGIGDADCDRAPLQIGQFESGIEIDEDLAKLWLEGGGGGQRHESSSWPCISWPARRRSITSTSEAAAATCSSWAMQCLTAACRRSQVAALLGDRLNADISTETLVGQLQEKYDTYFILPNLTSYYRRSEIWRAWLDLLGDHAIRLEDPCGISDLIAALIGVAEGVVDVDGIEADLRETGRGAVAEASAGR